MSRTGVKDGTCAPNKNGTDPDGECATESMASCGQDGMCDGKGPCRRWSIAAVCGSACCSIGPAPGDPGVCEMTCNGAGLCSIKTSVGIANCNDGLGCTDDSCALVSAVEAKCDHSASCPGVGDCCCSTSGACEPGKPIGCMTGMCL